MTCAPLREVSYLFVETLAFRNFLRGKSATCTLAGRPCAQAQRLVSPRRGEGGLQLPELPATAETQGRCSQETKLIICICYICNILPIKQTMNIYKHSMLYRILLNSLILPFPFIILSQNKKHC